MKKKVFHALRILSGHRWILLVNLVVLTCCSSLPGKKQNGLASFYVHQLNDKIDFSDDYFTSKNLIAAHSELPFGTLVRITNTYNNLSVIARIDDRMPRSKQCIVSVSYETAQQLDMVQTKIAEVELEVLEAHEVENEKGIITQEAAFDQVSLGNREDTVNADPADTAVQQPEASEQPAAVVKEVVVASAEEIGAQLEPGSVYDVSGVVVDNQGYGVQVGLFKDPMHALKACRELANNHVPNVYIIVDQKATSINYHIVSGVFSEQKKAQHYMKTLHEKGISDCFVQRYQLAETK